MTVTDQYQNELEQAFGSLPGIVQSALRPAYQPVDDALHWVCGDPDALVSAGQTYVSLGQQVQDVSTSVQQDVAGLEGSWTDEAGKAFKARMDSVCKALTGAGTALADTDKILTASAKAAVDAANTICDIVVSVVEFIIADFVVSAALSVLTFGASVAAGIAAAVAEWAEAVGQVSEVVAAIGRVLRTIEEVLRELAELFRALKELFALLKSLKQDASFLEKIGILAGKTVISKTTSAAWDSIPGIPNLPQGGVHWGGQAAKDADKTYQDAQQAESAG